VGTGAEEHDGSPPHVVIVVDNFPAAAVTSTSSPPPQREPLRVLLLTLLTTQGGVPQCHTAPVAAPCTEVSSPFSPCPAFALQFFYRNPTPKRRCASQREQAGHRPLTYLQSFLL
jgi:hypothetical protein